MRWAGNAAKVKVRPLMGGEMGKKFLFEWFSD